MDEKNKNGNFSIPFSLGLDAEGNKELFGAGDLCLLDFTRWCFPGLFSEMMKKHEGIIFEIEKQNPIISRSKLPNIIFKMFGDVTGKSCSILLQ